MSERVYPVKRGADYELNIEKLAFGGAGLGYIDQYVIFVKGTVPGDRVKACITKRKTGYAEARLLEVLEQSPQRQAAPCRYFGYCGGCNWQFLSYARQLEYKHKIVEESLRHIGGIMDFTVDPVIASIKSFGYRNKMEFSFSDRRWLTPSEMESSESYPPFALGLHTPGAFDKILHIEQCLLQPEVPNQILAFVSGYSRQQRLSPYGVRSQQGLLRFLVIRRSAYNGQIMINIVTAKEQPELLQPLADELMTRFPEIAGIVNNINTRPAQIAVGEKEILLAGQPVIQEKLGDFIFNISANSFFQTNTPQAEIMYRLITEFAEAGSGDHVWDLYCGTGTISLFLAQKAGFVTGFELAESAVSDARLNAAQHGVQNVKFIAGDLLHRMSGNLTPPQIVVTDPPRSGMHEKAVRYLCQIRPRRMVYVSCNPSTLARDLAVLSPHYRIDRVQPVDMFPQTYHIETVVKLTLNQ
jgi:23S rRNA (uracil1939-C5)-methyltransferase